MHLDLLRNYLARHAAPGGDQDRSGVSRRAALTLGAAAAGVAASLGRVSTADAQPARPRSRQGEFDDTYFDYSLEENLADWAPSIYGAGDQRGAFNEVTPQKTADALEVQVVTEIGV